MDKQKPLTALLMAGPTAEDDFLNSKTFTTIRHGARDYAVDSNILVGCPYHNWCWWGKVLVVHCCLLKELTEEQLQLAEFDSIEDALRSLTEFYPEMTEESPVTFMQIQPRKKKDPTELDDNFNTRTKDLLRAFFCSVKEEREYQLTRWSNEFDSRNTPNDWAAFILNYAGKMVTAPWDAFKFETALIKVAALCAAAFEWCRRTDGNMPKTHYDD